MSGYECKKCMDTGYMLVKQDGYDISVKCECYEKLMYKRRLRRSGISEEMQKKGFKDFDCHGIDVLEQAKTVAIGYYRGFLNNENSRHNSITFCGQVGAGKTHLGMAVCNNLLNVCHVEVVYMAYRNAITEIKQAVTDKENYYAATEPYRRARVLYIDDLLKGKATEADMNILYELINYRYMHNKPMIISTEKLPDELIDFDEAVGSRIIEMCRGNIIVLQGKELNYRLYSQKES